jgi:hypothetical protein
MQVTRCVIFILLIALAGADDCNDICLRLNGLCDERKGSWCNESEVCQNIRVQRDKDLCFINPSNSCGVSQLLACADAKVALDEAITMRKHRELLAQFRQKMQENSSAGGLKNMFQPLSYGQELQKGDFCTIC